MDSVEPASPSSKFDVGTLRYNKSGLVTLFVWLLWGDFCFQVMEMVILQVMPLKLRSLNASNVLVGFIIGTIPSAMTFMVNPIVGFHSDRYRSRYGRRIPFLLLATPPLTVSLILLGCCESIGYWLQNSLSSMMHVSPSTVVLTLVAVFTMMFQLFNMVVNSTYYYLINDVVPNAFIGRFLSLFRVVAAVAGTLFSFCVFPHAQTHMRAIFVGAGALYFVAFMSMCAKVKEGEYPPPLENLEGQKGLLAAARTYCSECFNHRFYWDLFLAGTFYAIAGCTGPFMTFLYLSVGVNLGQMGKVLGVAQVVSFFLWYPGGMWADRVHPLRIMVLATILFVITSVFGVVWLFIEPTPRVAMEIFTTYTLVCLPVTVLYGVSSLPMFMRLLPKERFGQFCSADAMVKSIAVIVATPLLGILLDALKWRHSDSSYYYRYAPLWTVTFHALSLIFVYRLYRYWKRHGGADHFQSPSVNASHPSLQVCDASLDRSPMVTGISEGSIT